MSQTVRRWGIDDHIALLTSERIAKRVVERTGGSLDRTRTILNTYAAECRYGFGLIAECLPARGRILEVGAGPGMLSSYLRSEGYDITALEPAAPGFDFFTQIREVVREEAGTSLPVLEIQAEELSPSNHGFFQFIFSINVLEHISDIKAAITGMSSVLAGGGRMWHTCPNYLVPYEPHFGIPLIPLFPRGTGFLLPGRISRSELWRGLNFITYFELKRLASQSGLTASFAAGTMAEALRRLEFEKEFAARQGGIPERIYRILKGVGAVSLIERMPAALSTPMIARMEKMTKGQENQSPGASIVPSQV